MKKLLTIALLLIVLSGCRNEPEKTKKDHLREVFNKQNEIFNYHFQKFSTNFIENPELAKKHADSMDLSHYMTKQLYREMYSEDRP